MQLFSALEGSHQDNPLKDLSVGGETGLSRADSPVELWFGLEEIYVEANLVSKNAEIFVEQHIQNPPNLSRGKKLIAKIAVKGARYIYSNQVRFLKLKTVESEVAKKITAIWSQNLSINTKLKEISKFF